MARFGRTFPLPRLRKGFQFYPPGTIVTTRDQNGVARILVTVTRDQTGKGKIATDFYSYDSRATLPSNDAQVANLFNDTNYTNAASDNSVYVDSTGTNTYDVFVFQHIHANNTSTPTISWNGKSTLAPSTSTVYLQVYNYNSTSWETIDSDNSTAANTDFDLTASITTNISNYYGTGNKITARVYQENV